MVVKGRYLGWAGCRLSVSEYNGTYYKLSPDNQQQYLNQSFYYSFFRKQMDKFHQELFGVLTQARRSSKAAAAVQPEMITICEKEYMDLQDKKCANIIHQIIRHSKAASLQASGINQAQVIHNFIMGKH